jgi:hypothetical protein
VQNLPKFAAHSAAIAECLCKICKDVRKISRISISGCICHNLHLCDNSASISANYICRNNQFAPSVQNWSFVQNLQAGIVQTHSTQRIGTLYPEKERRNTPSHMCEFAIWAPKFANWSPIMETLLQNCIGTAKGHPRAVIFSSKSLPVRKYSWKSLQNN